MDLFRNPSTCFCCGHLHSRRQCTCNNANYCSPVCQWEHWGVHQKTCSTYLADAVQQSLLMRKNPAVAVDAGFDSSDVEIVDGIISLVKQWNNEGKYHRGVSLMREGERIFDEAGMEENLERQMALYQEIAENTLQRGEYVESSWYRTRVMEGFAKKMVGTSLSNGPGPVLCLQMEQNVLRSAVTLMCLGYGGLDVYRKAASRCPGNLPLAVQRDFEIAHIYLERSLGGIHRSLYRAQAYEQFHIVDSYTVLLSIIGDCSGVTSGLLAKAQMNMMNGFLDAAEEFTLKAMKTIRKLSSGKHRRVSDVYATLARLLGLRYMYDEAIQVYTRCVRMDGKVYGLEHFKIAYHRKAIADLFQSANKYDLAENSYHAALRIYLITMPEDSVFVAEIYKQIACCEVHRGALDAARVSQAHSDRLWALVPEP
jgi:tetratricopeptide (TPR) repeat protein